MVTERPDLAIVGMQAGVYSLVGAPQSRRSHRRAELGRDSDTIAHGHDDGDDKNDVAIWRRSARQFWVLKSSGGVLMRYWGDDGTSDFVVAAANVFTSPGLRSV